MYIRTKRRKNLVYAYLVRSKRLKYKKVPKQKVIKYLGRVYKPVRAYNLHNADMREYFKCYDSKNIIKELIKLELLNHGFAEERGILKNNDLKANIDSLKVKDSKERPIVLELNEGFMCDYTLKNLLNYKVSVKKSLLEQGKVFADLLISCGLKVNENIFLKIFNKIHNP